MKYYIVYKNKKLLELIKEIIEGNHNEIYETDDFNFLLKNLNEINPDFIFLDFEFKNGNIDSLILTQRLLELKTDLKIILISDFDTASFQLAARKAGAYELLSKENLIRLKDIINQKNI